MHAGCRPEPHEIEIASTVVDNLFYRQSQQASVIQATAIALRLQAGIIKYSSKMPVPDLNAIIRDLHSEEARRACAHVRIQLNILGMFLDKQITSDWARYFWNRGKELIPLELTVKVPEPPTDVVLQPMDQFVVDFERYCRACLSEIWRKLPVDIYESEPYEVIGALLSRQCNLAIKPLRNPDLWDWHTGPIFLRAMTDTYITIAWIMKDPLDRSRKFISNGLGQEKLQVEHLKNEIKDLRALYASRRARDPILRQGHRAQRSGVSQPPACSHRTRICADHLSRLARPFVYSPACQPRSHHRGSAQTRWLKINCARQNR
jgi:hypothetical protein